LRKERRLIVFENRVLRGIFGPKKDEVTGEWRRKHYEVLYDLYWSPNFIRGDQIRKNEISGACSTKGDRRGGGLDGKNHLEDVGVDMIIGMKRGFGGRHAFYP